MKSILFSGQMVRAILDGRKHQTRRIVKHLADDQGRTFRLHDGRVLATCEPHEVDADGEFTIYGAPLRWSRGAPYSEIRIGKGPSGKGNPLRPKYEVGDLVHVRESWRVAKQFDNLPPRDLAPRTMTVLYEAGGSYANGPSGQWEPSNWPKAGKLPEWAGRLRPGIFLPGWASRLTLRVTSVRLERVQEISEADAVAEGFQAGNGSPVNGFATEAEYMARQAFADLWDHINAKPCNTCQGHGVVVGWGGSLFAGTLEQTAKDCPDCKGEPSLLSWESNPWVWVYGFDVEKQVAHA